MEWMKCSVWVYIYSLELQEVQWSRTMINTKELVIGVRVSSEIKPRLRYNLCGLRIATHVQRYNHYRGSVSLNKVVLITDNDNQWLWPGAAAAVNKNNNKTTTVRGP